MVDNVTVAPSVVELDVSLVVGVDIEDEQIVSAAEATGVDLTETVGAGLDEVGVVGLVRLVEVAVDGVVSSSCDTVLPILAENI
jgi:hypothetical protein